MAFKRQQYIDVYTFAESVFLGCQRTLPALAEQAERIMDACEDVVGQLRPHDQRVNRGRFSEAKVQVKK